MIKNVGGSIVSDDEKKPQSRTVNDVIGLGEGVKAVFSFFEKIIDKLPFEKLTQFQTQFILIFVVVNLLVTVLLLWDKISVNAFYIILAFDVIVGSYSLYLTKQKNDEN
jgi:hypothetical protein